MKRDGIIVLTLLLLAAGTVAISMRGGSAQVQQTGSPVPMALSGAMLEFTLGFQDDGVKDWDGQIKLSEGRVVRLDARLAEGEALEGGRWKLRSRPPIGGGQRARPVRLYALLEAPEAAKADVETKQGKFSFKLSEVLPGKPGLFLNGQVKVERLPLMSRITAQPTEDYLPAAAASADGSVWVAYLAYTRTSRVPGQRLSDDLAAEVARGDWDAFEPKGNGDQLKLMRFDGNEWSPPIDVTEAGLDLWRPTVAVDGQGGVWVAWSQNLNGNWEVYRRRYDPKSQRWDQPLRVSNNVGADINVVSTTDSNGNVWWAWQAWQGDNFDIALICPGLERYRKPVYLKAPANQWNPAIAADSKGSVYVAWDTYEKGNYDVMLQRFDPNAAGGLTAVAASPKFEARPSIACDKEDRVWIAYEESEANWGKDYGQRWEGRSGVPFYLDVRIVVRCYWNGKLQETRGSVSSEPINTLYPSSRRMRISFPRIAVEGNGRLWLLFRRHAITEGGGEHWVSFATYYDGRSWSEPARLAGSENLLDNRPGLVALKGSGVLAVYSGDGRARLTAEPENNNDLYASLLRVDGDVRSPELVAASATGAEAEPVHPSELQDVQRMRAYRVRVGGRTYQLLRGEFHRHTEISSHRDQDGALECIWRYGLDVAKLDWIGTGDHDNGSQEHPWWISQKQTDIFHHPPTFVPMFTYERSVPYPDGHRNVMFARRGIYPLPRYGTEKSDPEKGSPDVKMLYDYLRHFGGICSPHTSATGMGTDWRDNNPLAEPVVEIFQGHRQSYEHEGAPKTARSAQDSIGGYRPAGFVWNALKKGYRLGFQCSSDHISTHISYAVVLAERPTREAILDAFKRRHSYGATDNIILVVRSGDRLMGDEFETRRPPKFDIAAIGTAPISKIDIVRGVENETPTYVYTAEPKKAVVTMSWQDNAPVQGKTSYYYVRIQQADGGMAWASPMWVKYAR